MKKTKNKAEISALFFYFSSISKFSKSNNGLSKNSFAVIPNALMIKTNYADL